MKPEELGMQKKLRKIWIFPYLGRVKYQDMEVSISFIFYTFPYYVYYCVGCKKYIFKEIIKLRLCDDETDEMTSMRCEVVGGGCCCWLTCP